MGEERRVKKIGSYEIFLDEKLGQGTFGEVYIAKNGDQFMACKCVSRCLLIKNNMDPIAMLKHETGIMIQAKHENTVRFYDMKASKDNIYIFMELCQFSLLRVRDNKINKKLSEEEAFSIMASILRGYRALEEQNIVHRDIKSANILFRKGVPKLADFGFAKFVELESIMHTAAGTPAYMAPEILEGMPYTSKCDIYSFGVVLYEITHGCLPHEARNVMELTKKIHKHRVNYDPCLRPETVELMSRMLAIQEKDRISFQQLYAHPLLKWKSERSIIFGPKLSRIFAKDKCWEELPTGLVSISKLVEAIRDTQLNLADLKLNMLLWMEDRRFDFLCYVINVYCRSLLHQIIEVLSIDPPSSVKFISDEDSSKASAKAKNLLKRAEEVILRKGKLQYLADVATRISKMSPTELYLFAQSELMTLALEFLNWVGSRPLLNEEGRACASELMCKLDLIVKLIAEEKLIRLEEGSLFQKAMAVKTALACPIPS